MEESTHPENNAPIQRDELFALHNHYESIVKDELDFFFKYKNFYISILSALLAGTLTGLLSLKPPSPAGFILLLGPGLIGCLSFIGYKNIKVYYRRYAEAWITVVNIKAMLGLKRSTVLSPGILPPVYHSVHGGGFITQYKRKEIQEIFDRAEKEGATAEELVKRLIKKGASLKFAKYTLIGFALSAAILAYIILITCYK